MAAILDGIGESFFGLDRQWRIVYFNQACEAFFGLSREEAIGRVVWDVYPQTIGSEFQRRYFEAMESRRADEFQAPSAVRPGRWLEVRVFPTLEGLGVAFRDITERRRAEEAQRTHAMLLHSMTEGVSLSAEDGTIVYTNPAEDAMFGYAPGELIGRSVSVQNAYPPDENERRVAAVIAELKAKRSWVGEWRNRRKDGSEFITASRITAIELDGKAHWLCVQRDVTEAKRAQDINAHLAAIVASSADAIMSCTLEGTILTWNPGAERMFGYGAREAVGSPVLMLSPPERRAESRTLIERVRAGEILTFDTVRRRKDGSQLDVAVTLAPLRNAKGDVFGFSGGARDVTERRAAEAALREREAYIRLLLNSAAEGFYGLDRDGVTTLCNAAFLRMLGFEREEDVIGRALHDIIHHSHPDGSDLAHVDCRILHTARTGEPVHVEDEVFWRQDGTSFPVEYWAHPILRDGTIEGAVVTFIDVSERKRAEEQRKLLINELNHRVKNTLATVQSVVTQTLRNTPTAEQAQMDLEARLISLSRVHDVLTREHWEGASLHEIVRDALAPYQGRGDGRLRVDGPSLLLPPRMALALAMALQELATNAVKYGSLSDAKGRLDIVWHVEPGAPSRLVLRWIESGGPPVSPPTRRGFGSRLIERSLAHDLGGEVTMDFAPGGVACTVDAPLEDGPDR